MVASEANGFRHILWGPVNFTCQGAPYAFHPMYSSAAPPTDSGQPTAWTTWSAHTDNLSFSNEIGHFESKDGDGDDATLVPPCECRWLRVGDEQRPAEPDQQTSAANRPPGVRWS